MSNSRVDASWIGMGRPFRILKQPPRNPFQYLPQMGQTEPMSASFYPDGSLEYLFSRNGEFLHIGQRAGRGSLHAKSWAQDYQETGYFTILTQFESENPRFTPQDFGEWVRRSIDFIWEESNNLKIRLS